MSSPEWLSQLALMNMTTWSWVWSEMSRPLIKTTWSPSLRRGTHRSAWRGKERKDKKSERNFRITQKKKCLIMKLHMFFYWEKIQYSSCSDYMGRLLTYWCSRSHSRHNDGHLLVSSALKNTQTHDVRIKMTCMYASTSCLSYEKHFARFSTITQNYSQLGFDRQLTNSVGSWYQLSPWRWSRIVRVRLVSSWSGPDYHEGRLHLAATA